MLSSLFYLGDDFLISFIFYGRQFKAGKIILLILADGKRFNSDDGLLPFIGGFDFRRTVTQEIYELLSI